MESEIVHKIKEVKMLLLDVDGVLTDGSIIYNDVGQETKTFNVKDGLGIKLLIEAGILVGIVTARRSNALIRRCKDLGIELLYDGVRDKAAILERVLERTNLTTRDIAFMGDDLPDLGLLKKVGLSFTVADAHETILDHADITTSSTGGAGAVREVCEMILKSKGLWEDTLNRFL